ncbi:hypothetical protein [Mucilaginibacter sp.]|uniref:hypothetical protein n=1 Tax=Mucilaginibacter sp. TaxID=1882438 RepID=UPI0025DC4EBB|nr:hypothetical protein [Mucilaginibacter sp.]
MKNTEVIPDLKGRKFNGHLTKIKRIRTEPRQRIRQLLRSFVPLDLPGQRPGQQQQIP